jgi:hypothetical protein
MVINTYVRGEAAAVVAAPQSANSGRGTDSDVNSVRTLGVPVFVRSMPTAKNMPLVGRFVTIVGTSGKGRDPEKQVPGIENSITGSGTQTPTLLSGDSTDPAQLVKLFLKLQGPRGDDDGTGLVKLSAQVNVNATKENTAAIGADFRALDLYNKARIFEDQGSLLNSLTHFREALKACIEQGDPDPVFKHFLEGEVERMNNTIKESAASDTDP